MNSHFLVPEEGWQMLITPPGAYLQPSAIGTAWQDALPAKLPCTAASALQAAGQFAYGQQDFDRCDIWFRTQLHLPADAACLEFDGLAGIAEVFWNDQLLLTSENMFLRHRVDVQELALQGSGELSLRFIALETLLAQKRPRPRWKTRLVSHQQLRWQRVTLLGRMPGWSPPVAPVGPYLPVRIRTNVQPALLEQNIQSRLMGNDGVVSVNLKIAGDTAVQRVLLHVGDRVQELTLSTTDSGEYSASGELLFPQPRLWWPHTHGEPYLYACCIEILGADKRWLHQSGQLGFRHIHVDRNQDNFHLHVNDVPVFCRGVCWMPADPLSLNASPAQQRAMLTLARDAGMNMLRVVGTMAYENDAFYQLCDELGILVWQDFMFANMDYPVADLQFGASIIEEARQFLARTQISPSLAVFCGNSEIEQQAAMLGQAADNWSNPFFQESLPALCQQWRPDTLYWPSSPSGGVLPFQVDAGIAHYFGVGAYLRPLEDARLCGVRFTTECLGFSNMPEDSLLDSMANGEGDAPGPHVSWKQRIPRDHGTGWDFEDVRDHYMAQLYQTDAMRLRYSDRTRYTALARTTTGELIERTVREWRRHGSACHGALIWFWRDLWAGAGWGLIDADGRPKAAYYFAKRAMQPLTVTLTDEGLNGLAIHVINDGPQTFNGHIEFQLWRHGDTQVASGRQAVTLPAHSSQVLRADALLPYFLDTTYAYRFGPAGHHVSVVHLYGDDQTEPLASDYHFPLGQQAAASGEPGLQITARKRDDGQRELCFTATRFAQAMTIQAAACVMEDNYFHLCPGVRKTIVVCGLTDKEPGQISVSALNMHSAMRIPPSSFGS